MAIKYKARQGDMGACLRKTQKSLRNVPQILGQGKGSVVIRSPFQCGDLKGPKTGAGGTSLSGTWPRGRFYSRAGLPRVPFLETHPFLISPPFQCPSGPFTSLFSPEGSSCHCSHPSGALYKGKDPSESTASLTARL